MELILPRPLFYICSRFESYNAQPVDEPMMTQLSYAILCN